MKRAGGHAPDPAPLLQRATITGHRQPLARARRDAELKGGILAKWIESGGIYGCPRIHAALLAGGERVGRLMRGLGIEGVTRGRFRTGTTKRDASAKAAPDLVNRDLSAEGPDEFWIADITQVRAGAGWLYLAVVLDAWSRRIVGWAMASRMPAELVGDALKMAISTRQPKGPVIHPFRSRFAVHVTGFRSAVPGGGRSAVDELGGRCVRQRDERELLRVARVRTPLIGGGSRPWPRHGAKSSASSRASTTPADPTRRWAIAARPPSRGERRPPLFSSTTIGMTAMSESPIRQAGIHEKRAEGKRKQTLGDAGRSIVMASISPFVAVPYDSFGYPSATPSHEPSLRQASPSCILDSFTPLWPPLQRATGSRNLPQEETQ